MARILFFIAFIYIGFGFTPKDVASNDPYVLLENNIIISPNPAVSTTKVFANKTNLKIKKVEVYSMLNEKLIVVNSDIPKSAIELNVFKLRNGKYFVKVFLSDGSEHFAALVKID